MRIIKKKLFFQELMNIINNNIDTVENRLRDFHGTI